jgi:imidazolonepropionase-like amidohydrolase
MKRHGIAKVGLLLGKMGHRTTKEFEPRRMATPEWNVSQDGRFIIHNINVVDVADGKLRDERAVLINGKKIDGFLTDAEMSDVKSKHSVELTMDGHDNYLIPGMSDLHCHVSLISEFDMSLKNLYYHDAQRERNCEAAVMNGVTFVRDSGGAYDMVHSLKSEIDSGKLIGPKILPSYEALSCKGGMWDINPIVNTMSPMIFGGRVLHFARNDDDIHAFAKRVIAMGSKNLKIYLEDRPLYGGKVDAQFKMFNDDQVEIVKDYAGQHNLPVESHSMFIKGSRLAIKHGLTNIAHMTVDSPYTEKDANDMVENNVAIVPTTSIGAYLAFNYGDRGYSNHEDVKFFRHILDTVARPAMDYATIPEIRHCYVDFWKFISEEMADRKMPGVGQVYPDRAHGFALNVGESFKNFMRAGVKIGIGTDGGSGIGFCGVLVGEFEVYERYGMTPAEVLRCATLTNMEILNLDAELGTLDVGKYADMVILEENPLESVMAIRRIDKVFKNGRMLIDNSR